MFQILVCEDDNNIRGLMSDYLRRDGYHVFETGNGQEALDLLDHTHIDLLITDVLMPELDGYDLVSDLRGSGYNLPILMITAKETYQDKRQGFHLGVDDYMVKPIDMKEMLLRVEALLRRARIASEKKIQIGGTLLDYERLSVTVGSQQVELPKKEFMLLFMLLSQPGYIFTRRQIMDEIWGYDSDSDEQTVNVHIKRLRDKFKDNLDFDIITIKGLGYKAVKK